MHIIILFLLYLLILIIFYINLQLKFKLYLIYIKVLFDKITRTLHYIFSLQIFYFHFYA